MTLSSPSSRVVMKTRIRDSAHAQKIARLSDQKGPNCLKGDPHSSMEPRPLANGFKKSASDAVDEETRSLFEKRYRCSEKTGRPNQVFVCLMCQAQRPKLSKILKHLNVHKKDRVKKKAKKISAPAQVVFKLPSMQQLLSNKLRSIEP